MCPLPCNEIFIPSTDSLIHNVPPPILVEEIRGRSRSRSPHRPICMLPCRRGRHDHSRSSSRGRSRSRSSSPRWRRRSRSRSFSPPPRVITIPPPSPLPIPIIPPAPPAPAPIVSPPSWYATPPSGVWPTYNVPKQPVDILTFEYNKNMAYVPATKTYEVRLAFVYPQGLSF
jgi:hypothetical protein